MAAHAQWLARTSSSPRRSAPLPVVSYEELARHSDWTALHGIVFDVSEYKLAHPGGRALIERNCGKDATDSFAAVHPWVNFDALLHACAVGRLEKASSVTSETHDPTRASCLIDFPSLQQSGTLMMLWTRAVTQRHSVIRFALPRGTRLGLSSCWGQSVRVKIPVLSGSPDTVKRESGLSATESETRQRPEPCPCRTTVSGQLLRCELCNKPSHDASSGAGAYTGLETDDTAELVVLPVSHPLATDYVDFLVCDGGTGTHALLTQLKPGDIVEVTGATQTSRLPAHPASPTDGKLRSMLTAAAWSTLDSGCLAFHVPRPSGPSTAAWPWHASVVSHIGVCVQSLEGLSAVMTLLQTMSSPEPGLASQPVALKAPSDRAGAKAVRVHVIIDWTLPDQLSLSEETAVGEEHFPLAQDLGELLNARGSCIASVTVLLPHSDGSDSSPSSLPSAGSAKTLLFKRIARPPWQQVPVSAAWLTPGIFTDLARGAGEEPRWPTPSETTLLLCAGSTSFCESFDDAARAAYYLASHTLQWVLHV